MTTFDDREQAFENRYAHDAEIEFRVVARRNRLLGGWAADRMGLTAAEAQAYATAVVQAEFEEAGDEDVVRKVLGDLLAAGQQTSEIEVRQALSDAAADARLQLLGHA